MAGNLGHGQMRLIHEIVKSNWGVANPENVNFKLNDILFILQEMHDQEGMKYFDEDKISGRGFKVFREFAKHLLYRNLANYDSMVLLTSEKGCLTDDTKIMMPRDLLKYPEGIPIKDLIGKGPIHVYSFNKDTKQLELKKSDGVEFAKHADVYELELVTGQKVKATEDHPFMLMDGSYKKLNELVWLDKIKDKPGACFSRYREKSVWKYTDRLRMVITKPDVNDYLKVDYSPIKNGSDEFKELVSSQRKAYFDNKNNVEKYKTIMQKNGKHTNMYRYGGVVKNITYIGKEDVYDVVNVQDNKNFIANGFVVSNTGKCVYIKDDNDFVVSANGELVHPKDAKNIVFMDNNMKLQTGMVKQRFERPEKDVFEILLRSGKRICLTKEHPLYTINGWKEVKDLKQHDFIATPRTYKLDNNKDMNKGLVKLLAYIIADGFCGSRKIEFTKKDTALRADFKCSLSEYDNTLSWGSSNRIINKNKTRKSDGTYSSNNTLMNYLKEIGLYGKKSGEKFIPKEILILKNELISLFLNRLYSCDGGVEIGKTNKTKEINYTTKSELMSRQIQHLLLRFGIVASLKHKLKFATNTQKKTKYKYWQLTISGKENIINFYDNIGFFHSDKNKKLEHIYNIVSKKPSNTNVDVIPYGVLKNYIFKTSTKDYAKIFDVESVRYSQLQKGNVSLKKFKLIAEAENDEHLLMISNSDIFWDKIISITHISVDDVTVYDLEVDDPTHNFICNDIIIHNSSAAILLAREWCKIVGIRFDPNRHIAYSNQDVMNKIDMLNKFEPLVADESVRFASSADWAKTESKELRKKLAEVRTKHLLFILCFPLKIQKMEKNYLESFVNYWCLTGDTKIITRDKNGIVRNTPINKLNKYNPEVLSYNIKTKTYEFKTYDKKIKTKKDAEIFEIELVNGLKIKCTEGHPFLTQRGWVRLKDLKDDDKIEVKSDKCKYCSKEFIKTKQHQLFCCKTCTSAFHVRTDRQKKYNKEYLNTNREKNKQICKKNYYKNKSERLVQAKRYRKKNKHKINNYAEKYRKANKVLLRKRDKHYRETNKEHYINLKRENWKKYRSENINFKLRENLRNAMRRVLKTQQSKKTHPIFNYLGCSIEDFKTHISAQFKDGMTWENWGKDTWNIDHIKPCSHFDLTKESERYKCFSYKNQQPLWASENWSKGDRYVG